MIEIELAHHVPLIGRPLRWGVRRNFCGVILEGQSLYLIHSQRTRVETSVLIPRFFRWVIFWIAPAKLHRDLCADSRPRQTVSVNLGGDRAPVDINLHSSCAAGAIVSKEDMFPRAVSE